jgi:DNA-binding FrmR family transcriptional regulator
MDNPTRQRIEKRIAELEQGCAQMAAQLAARQGALQELRRLLKEESIAPAAACGDGCASCNCETPMP